MPRGRRLPMAFLVVVLCSLAAAGPTFSAGRLDPSFGQGGLVISPFGPLDAGGAEVVLIQPDRRIVAGGMATKSCVPRHCSFGLGLVRYLPDGSVDRSFGDGGRVVTNDNSFSGVFAFGVSAMARQRDGKLVAVASGGGRGATIVRYTGAGALDPGFGDRGVVIDPAPDCGCVPAGSDVAVTPAGRILVGAVDAGVIAYRPDGSRDLSFGVGGRADIGQVAALALQPDGGIVASVVVADPVGAHPALVRTSPGRDSRPDLRRAREGRDRAGAARREHPVQRSRGCPERGDRRGRR